MRTRHPIPALLLAVVMLLWPLAQRASAATSPSPERPSVQAAADWIVGEWNAGRITNPSGLADAMLALAAAETHEAEAKAMAVKLRDSGAALVAEDSAGSTAKFAVALMAVGESPRTFLERDLVADLNSYAANVGTAGKDGGITLYFNPHFAVIALVRAGEPVPTPLVEALLATQQGGAFGYSVGGKFTPDPDYTAMGITALQALEGTDNASAALAGPAKQAAIAWAQDPANQKLDAGNHYWATYSSANSTGLMAAGLHDAGIDVSKPVAYLEAQQQLVTGKNAWAAAHNGTRPNLMATTQAILGVAGRSFATASLAPAPAPVPSSPSAPSTAPTAPPASTKAFTDADVRSCTDAGNVFVIVDPISSDAMGGCATEFATGYDALISAGFTADSDSFVKVLDGIRADYVLDKAYWSYWHRMPGADSAWEYSQLGLGSYEPQAGSVEGWSITPSDDYDGVPPRWSGLATETPHPAPTTAPTVAPSTAPTVAPSTAPTVAPTTGPSAAPSSEPTVTLTTTPTKVKPGLPSTGV